MSALAAEDIRIIARIVARHYSPVTRERVIPAVTELRTERRKFEEPTTEQRERDDGPVPDLLAVWIVANIIGVALFLVLKPFWVVMILAAINAGGYLGAQNWRRIGHEDVQTTRIVEREIEVEVEVEPERVEKEVVCSHRRVLAVGRGRIGFRGEATSAGVLVTGPPDAVAPRRLLFPTFDEPERILKAGDPIEEALGAIPWVLEGERQSFRIEDREVNEEEVALCGIERQVREHFEDVSGLFSEIRTEPILLSPVTDPVLITYLRTATGAALRNSGVEELETRTGGLGGEPLERFCESWLIRWARVNAALFEARRVSLCDELAPECFDLGKRLGYGSFNFYCPECTKSDREDLLRRDYSVQTDEVLEPIYFSKNARCVYLPVKERWRCSSCEREVVQPIPIHKVLDEVLFPTYDRLMEEHKLDRLKAHERARNREIERRNELESELEKVQVDQLSAFLALSDEMERFHADVAGEEEAISSMEEILGHFDLEKEATILAIQSRSREMRQAIDLRAREALGRIDRVKEEEMAVLDTELTELSQAKRLDDERRDAIQLGIVRGLGRVEGRIAEGNEVNRQGFQRVEGRIAEGNEVNRQGFQRVEGRIAEGNEISRQGFQRVEGRIAQGNSIQAAVAKKSGIDLHDESIWRLDRQISHVGSDIMGFVTGRSTMETEAAKLDTKL